MSSKKLKFNNNISIQNKKAKFNYEFLDKYEAGIQLFGTEIKSIRMGKVNIAESFCQFINAELYIINMNIDEYILGTAYNHKIKRDRKLLLHKRELLKLEKKTKDVGLTIVPLKLFINDRGRVKILIALARGKKLYDKRQSIKERDITRDLSRISKKI